MHCKVPKTLGINDGVKAQPNRTIHKFSCVISRIMWRDEQNPMEGWFSTALLNLCDCSSFIFIVLWCSMWFVCLVLSSVDTCLQVDTGRGCACSTWIPSRNLISKAESKVDSLYPSSYIQVQALSCLSFSSCVRHLSGTAILWVVSMVLVEPVSPQHRVGKIMGYSLAFFVTQIFTTRVSLERCRLNSFCPGKSSNSLIPTLPLAIVVLHFPSKVSCKSICMLACPCFIKPT